MSWRHAVGGVLLLALGLVIGIFFAGGDGSDEVAAASTSTAAIVTTSGPAATASGPGLTTVTTGGGGETTVTTTPATTTAAPATTATTTATTLPASSTTVTSLSTTTTAVYVLPEWERLASGQIQISLSNHTQIIWTDPQVRFDVVYHEGVPALRVSHPWWFVSSSDPGEPWWVCLDQPATPAANPIKLSLLGIVQYWYGCVAVEDSIVVAVYLWYIGDEEVVIFYNLMDLDA